MLKIRWMKFRDAPEIYTLERLVFGPNAWHARQFIRRFEGGEHLGVVAFADTTPFGYLIVRTPDTGVGVIESIAVAPPARRQRIGSLMLAKLCDSPAAMSMGEWTARVAEADTPAQHFFKANGFKATHVERCLGQPDFYHFHRPEPLPRAKADHASNQRSRPKRRSDRDSGARPGIAAQE